MVNFSGKYSFWNVKRYNKNGELIKHYKYVDTNEEFHTIKKECEECGDKCEFNLMGRYCEKPVEEMTILDKIQAIKSYLIAAAIHVYPKFGEHIMASSEDNYSKYDGFEYMYLYDINYSNVVFASVDRERMEKEKTDKPQVNYHNMWNIPLNWLADHHLAYILNILKETCKDQLKDLEYDHVLLEIGEY